METKSERKNTKEIQDKKWYAKMAALEANWRSTIADTREEFLQDLEKLSEKR